MDVEQLTEWLWCLRTPIVQAYAVRERDGVNLVDSLTAGEELAILSALAEIDRRPPGDVRVHEVLLTHGHDDHTGSAAALVARTGARVVAARDEAGVIAGERPAPEPRLADWEVPLYERVTPNVPVAPPVVPDRLVGPGDRLGWGHDATIVPAPGHTPGHVAVWFEAERVLVAGDALASHEGRPMVGAFNADPAAAAASARRLASLDAEIACFGHGEPLRGDAGALLAELARAPRPNGP
jgi:glyoxylase-like metal-dependent hydrolase (beta-lactamase superfamily II)